MEIAAKPYIPVRQKTTPTYYTVQGIQDYEGIRLKDARVLCAFAGIPRNAGMATMVMPVVIMSYMTCQGGAKEQMAVIMFTNYTTTDSHGHSVIEIVATVYWLGLEGAEYDEIQQKLFNVDGITKLHALHWMGYKLEMMRDLQIIRPYGMMRTFTMMKDLPLCTNHVDNSAILGKYGENEALMYIVEATKRQQSKGYRLIIHWNTPPERTNLEIIYLKRLYWFVHKHEMHVEQYAVVGMTSLVQITNLRHQGAYTKAEDEEEGMDDDGRESEDDKEHTPTQELADTMAAIHILDATRNVDKLYRAATTEGPAWSTIGPKDRTMRVETIGTARQGGGTAMGNRGEGRSGYARGEGRGGAGRDDRRRMRPPQQQEQVATAEGRVNDQMETDTKRTLAQLQAEVAALEKQKNLLQQDVGSTTVPNV
eukprot:gene7580-15539_t